MADFRKAYYPFVKPIEGGWVNHPNDKGLETYAGISRRFHPSWEGWTVVDFYKKYKGFKSGFIKQLDPLVEKFYKGLWDKQRMSEIKSQDLANIIYDFYINSGSTGIREVQKILGVGADGAIGPITLAAINTANPNELHTKIKARRKEFYDELIAEDPSQEVFRSGWYVRLAKFPDLGTVGTVGIALGIGFFF